MTRDFLPFKLTTLYSLKYYIRIIVDTIKGMRWRSWLRRYAARWKVAGSISGKAI
jgi:hypothetical protein